MKYLRVPAIVTACLFAMGPAAYAQSIVAEKNGIQVSESDIAYYIQENVPPERRQPFLEKDKAFKDLVENLYVIRSLAAEAKSLSAVDEELARWTAEMKFQRELVAQYRVAYIRKTLGDTDWDALALETYKAEPESYMTKDRVRASHILIKETDTGEEEALQLAQKIRDRALAGEDFAALAVEYTDDPAGKQNGGDLGFFGKGQMVPEFEDKAFALKEPGDISEVVKSPFGYHIIRLEGRKAAEPIPYLKVKDGLINDLQQKLGNQVWQDKVIVIRSGLRPHIDNEKLEKFASEYKSSQSAK